MLPRDFKDEARLRAEARFGFYKHLAVYFVINLVLFFINLVTGPGYWWCIWPLIGWGIAVALHAVKVFALDRRDVIIDRLTEEELRKRWEDRE